MSAVNTEAMPVYLAGAELSAHLDRGSRKLTWELTAGDEVTSLYQNAYYRAWVTVTEQVLLAGEPLHVWSERQTSPPPGWSREAFTERARVRIRDEVGSWLLEGDDIFDRLWTPAHRASITTERSVDALAQLERDRVWWEAKHLLEVQYTLGQLSVDPVVDRHLHQTSVRVSDYWQRGTYDRRVVVARLMLGNLLVGWLTDGGDVIPLEEP
jgi:hypothetical protein